MAGFPGDLTDFGIVPEMWFAGHARFLAE